MKHLFILLCLISMTLQAEFTIESEGVTQITYVDAKSHKTHTIECFEPVEVDLDFRYLQCLSHTIHPTHQIHFYDDSYDLYADQLTAKYNQDRNIITLDTLKIYGHVCVIQKKDDPASTGELQYALADQLDFNYKDKQMKLFAKEGSSVLFYDQLNNYRISAPEVHVKRNPKTGKATVQGVGKVRFSFKEDEISQFKKHFFGKSEDLQHAPL